MQDTVGGAFSGKDPSKVDRSAGFMLVAIVAKNIVACWLSWIDGEIQILMPFGHVAEPTSSI